MVQVRVTKEALTAIRNSKFRTPGAEFREAEEAKEPGYYWIDMTETVLDRLAELSHPDETPSDTILRILAEAEGKIQ